MICEIEGFKNETKVKYKIKSQLVAVNELKKNLITFLNNFKGYLNYYLSISFYI